MKRFGFYKIISDVVVDVEIGIQLLEFFSHSFAHNADRPVLSVVQNAVVKH